MSADVTDRPPRVRRPALAQAWFLLALACICLWRPLRYGVPIAHVALYAGFLVFYIVMPGRLVHARWFRGARDDWLSDLGIGATLGFALFTLGSLVLKAAGLYAAIVAWPLLFVPLLFVRARASAQPAQLTQPARPPDTRQLVLLLALVFLAVERTLHFPDWWKEHIFDLLFHVGNAAELAHNWPLRDPRFAGLALNYHFFAYALPAGASRVSGAPLAEIMLCTGVATFPALCALQVYNAGRMLTRSSAGALVATALVVLHADLGTGLASAGLPWAGWLRFGNTLDVGLYFSYSTCAGLVVFATLAIFVGRWLASAARPTAVDVLPLALLGFTASGVKGSVMPVVLAGLVLVAAWVLVRQRRIERRALSLALVLGIAALPMTALLSLGPGSYAGSILRVEPAALVRSSGFYRALSAAFAEPDRTIPNAWSLVATPLWLCGYLGLAGVGAWMYVRGRQSVLDTTTLWIVMTALAGALVAVVFVALGYSQLFFFYNGQLGLALLAGTALASRLVPAGASSLRVAAPLWLLAILQVSGVVSEIARNVRRDLETRESTPATTDAYRAGLDWLRTRTPPDALVLTRHDSLLISAYAERRSFYETAAYAAPGHALRWHQVDGAWQFRAAVEGAFPERRAVLERVFAEPSRESLAALEEFSGAHGPLYLLVDDVRFRYGATRGHWFEISPAPADVERFARACGPAEFANEALQIYRVR